MNRSVSFCRLSILVLALLFLTNESHGQTCNKLIPARSFTATAGLDGIRQSSAKAHQPDWGAVQVFRKNLCEGSGGTWDNAASTCRGTDCIDLVRDFMGNCRRHALGDGIATINDETNEVRFCTNMASLDSAGDGLDRAIGELFNSVAFTDYPTFIDWLIDGSENEPSGLQQLRSYMHSGSGALNTDRRNTHYLPVSAGFAQSSGLLSQDLAQLTMATVCQTPARWRYLPPSQYLWENACARLEDNGGIAINTTALEFIVAAEGGSAVLMHRLRQGYDVGSPGLSGLEFAAVEDNCPTCVDENSLVTRFGAPLNRAPLGNAGHQGARYYHYPAFHQPGFLLWLYIADDCAGSHYFPIGVNGSPNARQRIAGSEPAARATCWSDFTVEEQAIIEQAAQDSVRESYLESLSTQCHFLKKLDSRNGGDVQLNVVPAVASFDPATGLTSYYNCGGTNNVPVPAPNEITLSPTDACLVVDADLPYQNCEGAPVAKKKDACSADFVITSVSDELLTDLEAEHDARRSAVTASNPKTGRIRKQTHICTFNTDEQVDGTSVEDCQDILDSLYAFISARNGGSLPSYEPSVLFPNTCPQFHKDGNSVGSQFTEQ